MRLRPRSSIWLLLAAASPSIAWGQGALLQGGMPVSGQAPMYSGTGSQAVVQASGPAGGGGVGLGLTELLQVNRVPGTGPFGSHNCFYDNPITHVGGYHYFCLDANVGAGPLLSAGAGGGASPLPLQFVINGVNYQFPFAVGGIVGPSTTTIGHVAVWNNTTGTLLADDGAGLVLSGDLDVTGNAGITGNLTVSGSSILTGGVTTAGIVAVGAVNVTGNEGITGNLTVSGTGTFAGAITTAGLVDVGMVDITGNLGVTGAGTVSGALTSGSLTTAAVTATTGNFSGAVNTGALAVTGNIATTGNLTVTSINASGALAVGAASTFADTVGIASSLSVGTSASFGGNVTTSSNLTVNGAANIASTVIMAGASINLTNIPVSSGGLCVGITNAGSLYISGVTC